MSNLAWAVVSGAALDPVTSRYGGTDRPVPSIVDGAAETNIFVPCGGEFEHLTLGDHYLVEWRQNKWRFGKQQPPELIATLRQRLGVGVAALPPPNQYPPQPPPTNGSGLVGGAPPPLSGGSTTTTTAEDVAEWVAIYHAMIAALPNAPETTHRAAASTVFMSRRKH